MAALVISGYTFLVFFTSYVVVRVWNVIKRRLLTLPSSTDTSSLPQPASAGRAPSFPFSPFTFLRILSKSSSSNANSTQPPDPRWFWQRWRHSFHRSSLQFVPLHLTETELLPTSMPPSAPAAVSTFMDIPVQNQHSLIDLPLNSNTTPPRSTQNMPSSASRLQSFGMEFPVPPHLKTLSRSSSSDALPSYRPLTPTPIPASNRVPTKSPLAMISAGTASHKEDEGIPLVPITPPKSQQFYTMRSTIGSNNNTAGLPTPPLTGTFSQPDLTSTSVNLSPYKAPPLPRSSSANSASTVTQHTAVFNTSIFAAPPITTITPRIVRSTPETRSASPTPNLFTSPFLSSGAIPQALSLSPRSLSQYQYSNTLAYQQQHRRSRSLNGVPVKKVEKPEGWEKVFEDQDERGRRVENSVMGGNIEDSEFDLGKGNSLMGKQEREGKLLVPALEKKVRENEEKPTERRSTPTMMSRTSSAASSVYSSDIARHSFSPSTTSVHGITHFTAVVPKPIPLVDLENFEEEDEKEKGTPISMFDAWKMHKSGWGPYGFDFDTFGEDKTVRNEESGQLDVDVSVHRVLLDLASPVHAEASIGGVKKGQLIDLEQDSWSSDTLRFAAKPLVEDEKEEGKELVDLDYRESSTDMDTGDVGKFNALSGIEQSQVLEEGGQQSMSAVEEDLLSISIPSSPSPQRNILPLPVLSSLSLSLPVPSVTPLELTPVIASAPVEVIAVAPAIPQSPTGDETPCDESSGGQVPSPRQERHTTLAPQTSPTADNDRLSPVPVSSQVPVLNVQTPTPPASPPRGGRVLPKWKETKDGYRSGSTSSSESETSSVEGQSVNEQNIGTIQMALETEEEETDVNQGSNPRVIELVEVHSIEEERKQSSQDDETSVQGVDDLRDERQSSSGSSDVYPHQHSSTLSDSFSASSHSPMSPERIVIFLDKGLTASPESLSTPLPPVLVSGREREKTDEDEEAESTADAGHADSHEGPEREGVDVFVVPPSPTLDMRRWECRSVSESDDGEDERDDTFIGGLGLEITPASPTMDRGFGGNANGWDYGSDDEVDGYGSDNSAGGDLVMEEKFEDEVTGAEGNWKDEDDPAQVNTESESESGLKEAESTSTHSLVAHISESLSLLHTSLPGSFPDVTPASVPQNSLDLASELRQRPALLPRTPIEEAVIRTRSPLEIALAMQLRPGFGVGADPAWMVRFLMVMWGWVFGIMAGDI